MGSIVTAFRMGEDSTARGGKKNNTVPSFRHFIQSECPVLRFGKKSTGNQIQEIQTEFWFKKKLQKRRK